MFVVLNQDEKYKIETDIDDINADLSDSETELALINIYRIIQECVQNSISHSKGDWISVSLKDEKKFYKISIQDNGVGFDLKEAIKKNRHFGLLVVEERVFLLNGNIQINAENGTSILIEIPKKVEEE